MWFFGLIVVLLIGAVAVVASGRWGAMAPAYDDRPDLTVPARQALTADDLETARFGVGLRGYRMDEVDTLLERVAREVAERDRRIADLERAVSPIVRGPEGAGFTARADYQAADFEDTGYNKPILVGGEFPTQEPEVPAEPAVEADGRAELAAPVEPEAEPEPTVPPADLPDQHVVTAAEPPAAPAEDDVQAGGWFEEPEPEPEPQPQPAATALDGEPQAPVPLPPLLQELVHTHTEDEPEATPWFEAKQPPPDHTGTFPAVTPDVAADTPVEEDADAADSDGQPRGRHSAAPDVSTVQRPT